MKTKEKIILKSLDLFNELGCRPVTTNHIAQALDMSPGNLYYHFRCKEEIIREIFNRYVEKTEAVLNPPADFSPTLESKISLLEAIFNTVWEYRFFFREQHQLLAEDKILAKENRNFFANNLQTTYELHVAMRSNEILKGSDQELQSLTLNTWVTITSWMSFANAYLIQESKNEIPIELARHCIFQVLSMEKPFLSETAQIELSELDKEYKYEKLADWKNILGQSD